MVLFAKVVLSTLALLPFFCFYRKTFRTTLIQPEISICHVETDQMMMVGSPIPPRFDDPADGDIEVLTNMEKFKDIWGNEF